MEKGILLCYILRYIYIYKIIQHLLVIINHLRLAQSVSHQDVKKGNLHIFIYIYIYKNNLLFS